MMVRYILSKIFRGQKGITLLEILVALGITAAVSPLLAGIISQTFAVNETTTNRETAVKQIESALYYLSRDVQMAQIITAEDTGFPLSLTWTEWDNTRHDVTYEIISPADSSPYLQRDELINTIPQVARIVATNIDIPVGAASCEYDEGIVSGFLTVTVGTINSATETREFQIIPRPGQS
jgi:type II secretory pathway component PulJ